MNELKPFTMGNDESSWKTQNFRQSVVAKIEEAIQRSGMPTSRNSIEMENHVFQKAKSREEYLSMVARLILHVREINTKKAGIISGQNANQGQMQAGVVISSGSNPNQPNTTQPSNQMNQGGQPGPGGNQGMAPDPINALQNLASQGSRNNQMMANMGGPQMQGLQGMGANNPLSLLPNQMGPQGPMVSQQNTSINATNLLQTLNQRPQMANMQLQNKLVPGMGMVPNQGQMGQGNMMGAMGQMQSHMGNQMGGPQIGGMQNQMVPNMSVPSVMQNQMVGINSIAGQMVPNQMNPSMAAQMGAAGPNQMAVQMSNMVPNQMSGQAAQMSMMQHIQQQQQQRKPDQMMGTGTGNPQNSGGFPGAPRAQPPSQFLRQSPSPSAPSPAGMGGPSPASIGVMSGPMASPMSVGNMGVGCGPTGGVASPALAPSPSAHHGQHSQHMPQPQRPVGMAPSPGSALNTPLGAGGAAPSPLGGSGVASSGMTGNIQGDEHAYREKVRQLSKYIEPLRRMIARMVSDGENVEKLTKMKNLLDILSHPSKRMPLETLLKCEVVLEKLDFKRGESNPLHLHGLKEHQIFNPLLEVVNNNLQSPLANHTLKRTFGPCMEALSGPEIKNMPPPLKISKVEEPPPDIPDVLQGEIARLDSRFKVSLETMQLTGITSGGEEGGGGGGLGTVRLTAHLDDARLPCVPPVQLNVPRDYPVSPPSVRLRPIGANADASSFPVREEKALAARLARLPVACSISQLLDAWEMSVRQACAPDENVTYTSVPALGI